MVALFRTILVQPLFNLLILLTVWVPGHSLGWAIIALTLLIRLVLIPSAAEAIKQQAKMRALQPKLALIQETFKDNKEELAKEMMALYKEFNVHPLGSCLPLLIQLPILLAMFSVFRSGLDTSHFSLLYKFVPHPTTINSLFFGVNLSKPNIIFAVTAGILQ